LTNNKKDIGAYEYNGVINGIYSPEYVLENYKISQSASTITIKNTSDKSFSLSVVNLMGKVIHSTQVAGSVELSKTQFGQGVFILLLNDGTKLASKKVLF